MKWTLNKKLTKDKEGRTLYIGKNINQTRRYNIINIYTNIIRPPRNINQISLDIKE